MQWGYDLFECVFIVNGIEQAINHGGVTREAIAEYNIIIENSAKEAFKVFHLRLFIIPHLAYCNLIIINNITL